MGIGPIVASKEVITFAVMEYDGEEETLFMLKK